MGDAALAVVGERAAELLEGHVLVGHLLDDVGARDEHMARILDHEYEIGDRGGVDSAPGAGSHDGGYLRDHARGERIPQEDVRVSAEACHPFLNARAAAVAEADDGRAVFHRHVEESGDLAGVRLAETAPENGEVLGERKDVPAVHEAVPADDAVADDLVLLHAGPRRTVRDENAELLKGALVEQHMYPLARRETARFVDLLYSLDAAAEERLFALFQKNVDLFLFGFQGRYLLGRFDACASRPRKPKTRIEQGHSSRCRANGQRECKRNAL